MNITVTYDLFRLQALFLTELFYKAVAHDLLRRQVLSFTELFYKAVAHDLPIYFVDKFCLSPNYLIL